MNKIVGIYFFCWAGKPRESVNENREEKTLLGKDDVFLSTDVLGVIPANSWAGCI